MNKLATALHLADIAMAGNYFLRVKKAARRKAINGSAFDDLSDLAVAAAGVLQEKQASMQEFGVTSDEALNSALYDAAKGVLRLRTLSLN